MAKKSDVKIPQFDNSLPDRIMVSHYSNIIRLGTSRSGHCIYQKFGGYGEDGVYTLKLRNEPWVYDCDKISHRHFDNYTEVTKESAEAAILNDDPSLLVYVEDITKKINLLNQFDAGKLAWERRHRR